ncbi:alpha/beta hydrolase [Klenkia brasiliensis]|uniref:Acetyl esterase/lipase n=1 Tax=Klenkia brasiliensis TaxID=333142 RepID=A0A1G8AB54_9ACTN|nr:alpha/beta hydrolase [Klenkia brasiliensis]SDH18178.1 Acetyl esterase/lipase [Klenkia brasiliensis]
MSRFHPDLSIARFIPPITMGPRVSALLRKRTPEPGPVPDDVLVEDVVVPGAGDCGGVPLRLYRPRMLQGSAPALLWMHGGGMIIGHPLQDEPTLLSFARTLGMTVAAVRYRLAPAHPAPAALEDCYAALRWLADHAHERGIDADRIAIGGASAGGGLAAGLALLAHDRAQVTPAFQLLVYPMIDDRTVTRTDHHVPGVRMWTKASNRYGWTAYLGQDPGGTDVSPYAAPARRDDLSGLPPAWIGVGTLDLFHDEDVAYAHRLRSAGVPCKLDVVDGAFHGFDAVLPNRTVSRDFLRTQTAVLQRALFPDAPSGARLDRE